MANEFIARNGVIALANSSISGSLTVSAGITGSFSGSLVGSASYATTANSASYALTASYVSGSSGSSISASYALTASYAQNAVSASFFSGSISNAVFATSASYAATASFALNAGSSGGGTVGGQALLTQSLAATTWSFTHNLGTTYPVITVYDGASNSVIQPLNIVPSGSNNINIYFSSPKTGYATAVAGGGYFVTNNGTTRKLVQSTPSVTWSFQHNIGDQWPSFQVFDSNNNVVIPANIRAVDAYTAEIQFAYSASGTAIATLGGGIGVGDVITVTSASSTWSLTHNLNTTYPIVTIWESGSNQIIQPDTITSVNANTILVTFTTPVKGFANISRAGSVISGSSDWNLIINKPNVGVVYSQSLAASTWNINHNLGAQWPLVTVYDNTNAVVLPQTIVSNDANNLTITFPSPQSGYANISRAGNYISGSILWSNITNGPFSTTGSVTNFTGSALQVNGTNFVAGTLFGVSNQNSESIAFNPAVSQSVGRILFFDNAAGTYTTARLTANNFEFQGPSNNTLMYISGSNRIVISGSVFVSGSLTVSGSGTLNNIGPANFTGSVFVTGSSIFTGPVTASSVLVNPSGPGFITIGASGSYGSISSGGSNAPTLYMNGSVRGGATTAASNAVILATDGNFYISDSTANTHKMFVSASGNIGIGTTSPLSILDVRAGAGISGSILNLNNTTPANASNIVPIRFYAGNSFGGLEQVAAIWATNPNASSNNGGALSFGTSTNGTAATPSEKMRLDNDGTLNLTPYHTTAKFCPGADTNHFMRYNSSLDGIEIGGYSGIAFSTLSGTERMRINTSGNVGIGITSPGSLLDVNGTTAIRGMNASILSLIGDDTLNSNWGITWKTTTYTGGVAAIRVARRGAADSSDMMFFTAPNGDIPNERMRINGTGNILMGLTTDGGYKLQVGGVVSANSGNYHNPNAFIAGSNDTNWSFGIYNVSSTYYMQVNYYGTGDDTRGFRCLNKNGDLVDFRVNGAGNGILRGSLTQNASDKRLKDNIKNIDNALEKVISLNGVTFDWNEEKLQGRFIPEIKINDAGVLAQDVQKVLPQAVAFAPFDREDGQSKSGQDYLTVKYEKIVPLLIEAIKELTARVQELENK